MNHFEKIKRPTAFILLVVLLVSLLAGCGAQSSANTGSEATTEVETAIQTEATTQMEATTQAEITGPIEITDHLGRTVTIEPANVNRIISAYTISTSLLIALGVEDKLVGIEINAQDKPIYKAAAPQIIELPAVGSGKGVNVEECANLKPDLIIIPTRLKEFVPQFESLGITVIAVAPETMESFMNTVDIIGKAVGAEERANALISYYDEKIKMVEEAGKNFENKPVVYFAGSKSPLTTCTAEMYQSDLIALAGGVNASQEIVTGHWANVSMEQVLAWNPDVILSVQYSAFGDEEMTQNAQWQSINAVSDEKVYRFPSKFEPWDYPAPSSILGILWLTNKLHPEAYSEESFNQDAHEFFKMFYDIEVTDEDMGV